VIVIVAAVFALAGGGGKSGPQFKASTNVHLTVGTTKVESTGAPVQLGTDVSNQVLSTLGTYVDQAIVTPLRKGVPGAALTKPFDAAAAAKLTSPGPDRAVLVDEHLPKAVGKITVSTPPVALTGLAGNDGKVILVTAAVNFTITARAANGTVRITRVGSFVFAQDQTGAWKIDAWTIHVQRAGPGVPAAPTTSTSAPAASSSTTSTTKKK
jgi:hypothetical protein